MSSLPVPTADDANVGPSLPFRDPARPRAERVEDLLARLTVGEKVNQLMHENNAVDRLGVPAYNWWSEACHGVARNGRATVFPQVIALAATWDRDCVRRVAELIADEARTKHHGAVAAGQHGQYQGLTFWTPNVNIFRDPRWGRGQETFGEDPFLTGELGVAMVRGLQGDDPEHLKVAACAKHFAVHSGPEAERHTFDARPTPKDLAETYLPAFRRLVLAGVEAVMGAYNRVLGEPACASRFLLAETLRGGWGFRGHVVSDCGAIDDIHRHHRTAPDAAAAAALALRNGCDLNCGCTYNDLVIALERGLITEAEIDVAVRRLLTTKFKLGLFDPPEKRLWRTKAALIDGPEHRAVARAAAAAGVVLLKNQRDTLPLAPTPARLLVVGPTAANINAMLGNYAGVSGQVVTFVEGIAERVDSHTSVEYRAGCALSGGITPELNYTFGAAAAADVVIAIVGLDPTLEGEEGDAVASDTGGDRREIELPAVQRAFLRELRRHAKTLILVVTSGSAVAIPEEHDFSDAVLYAWYLGCEGGRGLADVLFGATSPSGKLPVTVPRATADLPPFREYAMRGRTYRFSEIEPLYPFGFGLTYGRIRYGEIELSSAALREHDELRLSVRVHNDASRDVDEVVQVYVVPPRDRPDAPRATLVGFQRIRLPACSGVSVEFRLGANAFRQVSADGEFIWCPGSYRVQIGSASPGPRAEALGAPAPAVATVRLQ